uniref:PH domain-containing protein n=1 Tax=Romanomermis culicivorax TaxID=13658 RepID=A0A915ILQ9_ROMCU
MEKNSAVSYGKEPETDIITCRQTETAEHTYCLELCLKDESTVVQLACPTRHELQQWMCAFVNSFSSADTAATSCSCSACCLVITEHYLLIGQETSSIGFIRTLALSRLDALAEFKICRTFCSIVMTIALSSNSEKYECWLICFACRSELEVFLNTMKSMLNEMIVEEIDDSFHQWSAIEECYQHWTNAKYT